MDRRHFIQSISFAGAAASGLNPIANGETKSPGLATTNGKEVPHRTWLFWDWWWVEHQDNAELRTGVAEWVPEATYEDPTFTYLGFWPKVSRDNDGWKMLYFASGFPLTLMGAESDDGINWKPMNRPDVKPPGEKYAPNHLFSVPNANGGPVYIDPIASDGFRFKFYCIQRGGAAVRRAKLDTNSYFHEIVSGEGAKPYIADQMMAVSKDGLNWHLDEKVRWGQPPWHPDPPINCYYDQSRRQHVMVTRPGWGDRRVALQFSNDARKWKDLQIIMQPDAADPPQLQFYGMPVFPYEGAYVAFLWRAHFSNAKTLQRFNQLWGPIDAEFAYSYDGRNFHRSTRKPLVPNNKPGEPGSGVIYPVELIDDGDKLRIYSVGTGDLHHQYARTQFEKKKKGGPNSANLLHTLRKDGFSYLTSRGNWASLTTKPLVLLEKSDAVLSMNVEALFGEIAFEFTDLLNRPLPGYTFKDCIPIKEQDTLNGQIQFQEKSLNDLVGKIVRLKMMFRNVRVYAMRGKFHFCDALDVALVKDGKPIDPSFINY